MSFAEAAAPHTNSFSRTNRGSETLSSRTVNGSHSSDASSGCISEPRIFSARQKRCLREHPQIASTALRKRESTGMQEIVDDHIKHPCVGIEAARISPYCSSLRDKTQTSMLYSVPQRPRRVTPNPKRPDCHCACHRAAALLKTVHDSEDKESSQATMSAPHKIPSNTSREKDYEKCSCECKERSDRLMAADKLIPGFAELVQIELMKRLAMQRSGVEASITNTQSFDESFQTHARRPEDPYLDASKNQLNANQETSDAYPNDASEACKASADALKNAASRMRATAESLISAGKNEQKQLKAPTPLPQAQRTSSTSVSAGIQTENNFAPDSQLISVECGNLGQENYLNVTFELDVPLVQRRNRVFSTVEKVHIKKGELPKKVTERTTRILLGEPADAAIRKIQDTKIQLLQKRRQHLLNELQNSPRKNLPSKKGDDYESVESAKKKDTVNFIQPIQVVQPRPPTRYTNREWLIPTADKLVNKEKIVNVPVKVEYEAEVDVFDSVAHEGDNIKEPTRIKVAEDKPDREEIKSKSSSISDNEHREKEIKVAQNPPAPRPPRIMSEETRLEKLHSSSAALDAIARFVLPAARGYMWDLPELDDIMKATRDTVEVNEGNDSPDESKIPQTLQPDAFKKPTFSSLSKRRCQCSKQSSLLKTCECRDSKTCTSGNLCKGGPSLKALQRLVVEMGWIPGFGLLDQRLGKSKNDILGSALNSGCASESLLNAWWEDEKILSKSAPNPPTTSIPNQEKVNLEPILKRFVDLAAAHGDVAGAAAALDARAELEAKLDVEMDLKKESEDLNTLKQEADRQRQVWKAATDDLRRMQDLELELQVSIDVQDPKCERHKIIGIGHQSGRMFAQTRWIAATKQLQSVEARVRCAHYRSKLARLRALRDERLARAKFLRAACAVEQRQELRIQLEKAAEAQEDRLEDALRQLRAQVTARRLELVVFACAMKWKSFILRTRARRKKADEFCKTLVLKDALYLLIAKVNHAKSVRCTIGGWNNRLMQLAFKHWVGLFRGLHGEATRQALAKTELPRSSPLNGDRKIETGLDQREFAAKQFANRSVLLDAWIAWLNTYRRRRPRLARRLSLQKGNHQRLPPTEDIDRAIALSQSSNDKSTVKQLRILSKRYFTPAVAWVNTAEALLKSRQKRRVMKDTLYVWRWSLMARRPHFLRTAVIPASRVFSLYECANGLSDSHGYGFVLSAWCYLRDTKNFSLLMSPLQELPFKDNSPNIFEELIGDGEFFARSMAQVQLNYPDRMLKVIIQQLVPGLTNVENLKDEECNALTCILQTDCVDLLTQSLLQTYFGGWLGIESLARWNRWALDTGSAGRGYSRPWASQVKTRQIEEVSVEYNDEYEDDFEKCSPKDGRPFEAEDSSEGEECSERESNEAWTCSYFNQKDLATDTTRHMQMRELIADLWARRRTLSAFLRTWRTEFKVSCKMPLARKKIYLQAGFHQLLRWSQMNSVKRKLIENRNEDRMRDTIVAWRYLTRKQRRLKQLLINAWYELLQKHQKAKEANVKFQNDRVKLSFSKWRQFTERKLYRESVLAKIIKHQETLVMKTALEQCKLNAKAFSIYQNTFRPSRVQRALLFWHDRSKFLAHERAITCEGGELPKFKLNMYLNKLHEFAAQKTRLRKLELIAKEYRARSLLKRSVEPWLRLSIIYRHMRRQRLATAFKAYRLNASLWKTYIENRLASFRACQQRKALLRLHRGAHAHATHIKNFEKNKTRIEHLQASHVLRQCVTSWSILARDSYERGFKNQANQTLLAYSFRRFKSIVERRRGLRRWVLETFSEGRTRAFRAWRERTQHNKMLEAKAEQIQTKFSARLLRDAFYHWDGYFRMLFEKRAEAFKAWRLKVRRSHQELTAETMYRKSIFRPVVDRMLTVVHERKANARKASEFFEFNWGEVSLLRLSLSAWKEAFADRLRERAAFIRAEEFRREYGLLPRAQVSIDHWKSRASRTIDLRSKHRAVCDISNTHLKSCALTSWVAALERRIKIRNLISNSKTLRLDNRRVIAFSSWLEIARHSRRLRELEIRGLEAERKLRIKRTLHFIRNAVADLKFERNLNEAAEKHFMRNTMLKLRARAEEAHSLRAKYEGTRVTSTRLRLREVLRRLSEQAQKNVRSQALHKDAEIISSSFLLRSTITAWRGEFVIARKRKQEMAMLLGAWRTATLRKIRLRLASENYKMVTVEKRILVDAWENWKLAFNHIRLEEQKMMSIADKSHAKQSLYDAIVKLRRYGCQRRHLSAVEANRNRGAREVYQKNLLKASLQSWKEARYSKTLERASDDLRKWSLSRVVTHWYHRARTTVNNRILEKSIGEESRKGVTLGYAIKKWKVWSQESSRVLTLQQHARLQAKRFALRRFVTCLSETMESRRERMNQVVEASHFAAEKTTRCALSLWRFEMRRKRALDQAEKNADSWSKLTLLREAYFAWSTLVHAKQENRLRIERETKVVMEEIKLQQDAESRAQKCIAAQITSYGIPESENANQDMYSWSHFDDTDWRIEDEAKWNIEPLGSSAPEDFVIRIPGMSDMETNNDDEGLPVHSTLAGSKQYEEARKPLSSYSFEASGPAHPILRPLYPALHQFRRVIVEHHGLGLNPEKTIFLAWRAWVRVRAAHRQAHFLGLRARLRSALSAWRGVVLKRAERELQSIRLEDKSYPTYGSTVTITQSSPSAPSEPALDMTSNESSSQDDSKGHSQPQPVASRPKKRLTGPPLVREYLLSNARDGSGYVSLLTNSSTPPEDELEERSADTFDFDVVMH